MPLFRDRGKPYSEVLKIPEKERCRHCEGYGDVPMDCAVTYTVYTKCIMCDGTGDKRKCALSIEMTLKIEEYIVKRFGKERVSEWMDRSSSYFKGYTPRQVFRLRGQLGAEEILELFENGGGETVYYDSIITDQGNGISYCTACNAEFDILDRYKTCEKEGKDLHCPLCGRKLISGGPPSVPVGGSDF